MTGIIKKVFLLVMIINVIIFIAPSSIEMHVKATGEDVAYGDSVTYDARQILEEDYGDTNQKIAENLPDYAKDFLDDSGISDDLDWAEQLSFGSFFEAIRNLLTVDVKKIAAAVCGALGILLAHSVFSGVSPVNFALGNSASLAVSVCSALCLALPAASAVINAISVIKTAAGVITAFIPIFAGILAVLGKSVTSAGVSFTILGMAQVVGAMSAGVFSPLISSHISLTLSSVVSGELKTAKVAAMLKKVTNWSLTLVMSVFVFVLGAQTAIQSAADTVTLKTAKFIVGTGVPVVGGAVSEAVSTVTACVSMLGTSVGGYAVFAVAAVFLPVIVELGLWRLALLTVSAAAGLMSNDKLKEFADGIDSSVGLVVGILLSIFTLFVVSLSIVVKAGSAQ